MALTQISTQGIKDGTITGTDLATNVDLVDNQKLRLGTGNDLQIYHNSGFNIFANTNSSQTVFRSDNFFINNQANDENLAKFLVNGAVELYYDNSKKLETTSTGVTVHNSNFSTLEIRANTQDAVLRLTSHNNDDTDWAIQNDQSESNNLDFRFNNTSKMHLTSSGNLHLVGNLDLEDNDKLLLGTSDDLQIYHEGNHSYIQDAGTGSLILVGNNVTMQNAAQSENMFSATQDGSVDLYFNGSKKFETRNDGVLIGDSQGYYCGDGADMRMFFNGTDGFIRAEAGNLNLDKAGGEKFIICKPDAEVELYYDNSKKFETNSTGCFVAGSLGVNPSSTGDVTINKEGTGTLVRLRTTGTTRGSISSNGSTVAFNTSASDRSMKKNFEDWTEDTLALFKNINPQKFNFLDQEDGTEKEKGFIAQDMFASFPEAYQKNDDDKYVFNPSGMVVYLMKAIQELEAEVAALKAS